MNWKPVRQDTEDPQPPPGRWLACWGSGQQSVRAIGLYLEGKWFVEGRPTKPPDYWQPIPEAPPPGWGCL